MKTNKATTKTAPFGREACKLSNIHGCGRKKKKKKERKERERLFNLIRTCKTLCTWMGIKVRTSSSNPIKAAIKAKLTRRV